MSERYLTWSSCARMSAMMSRQYWHRTIINYMSHNNNSWVHGHYIISCGMQYPTSYAVRCLNWFRWCYDVPCGGRWLSTNNLYLYGWSDTCIEFLFFTYQVVQVYNRLANITCRDYLIYRLGHPYWVFRVSRVQHVANVAPCCQVVCVNVITTVDLDTATFVCHIEPNMVQSEIVCK